MADAGHRTLSRPAGAAGTARPRLAVVGAGWAGLAAAVEATRLGAHVTLFDAARRPGGRASSHEVDGHMLDNGQHLLVGAYVKTLALMRDVGVDPARVLQRRPLDLRDLEGRGLALGGGAPRTAFAWGVLRARGWRVVDKLALLRAAAGWQRRGFGAAPHETVADVCRRLPDTLRVQLIEPLCAAALNTPAAQASATVFLRVLHDALFAGPGSADLLIPTAPLHALLPAPACRWLVDAGATVALGRTVRAIERDGDGWRVDASAADRLDASSAAPRHDAVIVATGAASAARLAAPHAPAWAATARALRHTPIVTVWLQAPDAPMPAPMVRLVDGPGAPAQFVFDLGALGGPAGWRTAVASTPPSLDEAGGGLAAVARQVLTQLRGAWQAAGHRHAWHGGADGEPIRHVTAERRATFACTAGVQRPAAHITAGLWAAGDHVDGPYPATLEGAVRSGLAAARFAMQKSQPT